MPTSRAISIPVTHRLNFLRTQLGKVDGGISALLAMISKNRWKQRYCAKWIRITLLEAMASRVFSLGIPSAQNPLAEAFRRLRNFFFRDRQWQMNVSDWLVAHLSREHLRVISRVSRDELCGLIRLSKEDGGFREKDIIWLRRAVTDSALSLALDFEEDVRPRGSSLAVRFLDIQILSRRSAVIDEKKRGAPDS